MRMNDVGLNIFQTSVFLLYITMGKVRSGTAPILDERFETYSNPLPSVLILTAIGMAGMFLVIVSAGPWYWSWRTRVLRILIGLLIFSFAMQALFWMDDDDDSDRCSDEGDR